MAPSRLRRRRIIPAYAGSTPAAPPRAVAGKDHPRIRGEHHLPYWRHNGRVGSSPHTRGAPCWPATTRDPTRIIPAYAGSTTPPTLRPSCSPDHPRIRGEHVRAAADLLVLAGSSPHTRGAPHGAFVGPFLFGIIPAYAGSTTAHYRRGWARKDHPRIRGEHVE